MALTNGLSFTQNADIDFGVAADTSDYAVGGNPARSATANYLLWSKTDEDGVRTYTNPSAGSVFANLSYTVSTLVDGWYEGIMMRFTEYSGATAYVEEQTSGTVITQYASVVYYNGTIYKAIAPTTGNLPTDEAFWVAVTELHTLIDNTNVDVFVDDFYIKLRANQCANEKLASNCGCGCNGDLSAIHGALLVSGKILSADSAVSNNAYDQMEKIIRDIEQTCSLC